MHEALDQAGAVRSMRQGQRVSAGRQVRQLRVGEGLRQHSSGGNGHQRIVFAVDQQAGLSHLRKHWTQICAGE